MIQVCSNFIEPEYWTSIVVGQDEIPTNLHPSFLAGCLQRKPTPPSALFRNLGYILLFIHKIKEVFENYFIDVNHKEMEWHFKEYSDVKVIE